jgi:maltose alpha-D-glucosyltransferase/alpha-amylase
MRLNLGIRRRLAPLLDHDRRQIHLLNALLFTLPGSPIIYYGDEIGMGDDIWRHDRNGVRTPMQWDSSKNAGFSDVDTLYEPVIDDPVYGYQQVNVAQQMADPNSLWHTIRHMLLTRKQYRAFGRGSFTFALPENEAILGYWRVYHDELTGSEQRFLVVANLTGEHQEARFELTGCEGIAPRDILTGETLPRIAQPGYSLSFAPYAYYWLAF